MSQDSLQAARASEYPLGLQLVSLGVNVQSTTNLNATSEDVGPDPGSAAMVEYVYGTRPAKGILEKRARLDADAGFKIPKAKSGSTDAVSKVPYHRRFANNWFPGRQATCGAVHVWQLLRGIASSDEKIPHATRGLAVRHGRPAKAATQSFRPGGNAQPWPLDLRTRRCGTAHGNLDPARTARDGFVRTSGKGDAECVSDMHVRHARSAPTSTRQRHAR
jgi:hypothetical protein